MPKNIAAHRTFAFAFSSNLIGKQIYLSLSGTKFCRSFCFESQKKQLSQIRSDQIKIRFRAPCQPIAFSLKPLSGDVRWSCAESGSLPKGQHEAA